jgi:hypothetical protein
MKARNNSRNKNGSPKSPGYDPDHVGEEHHRRAIGAGDARRAHGNT